MSVGKGNCAICGKPLVYYRDAREMTCVTCGKRELGHSVCEDGHYVCDSCHRAGGVSCIMDVCLHATSANPIEIAMRAMDDNRIYPNGPEHHTLTGAALLAGYANAGGELDLENGLAELRTRSLDVPGGHLRLLGRMRFCDERGAGDEHHRRGDAHVARAVGSLPAPDLGNSRKHRRTRRSALLQAHVLHRHHDCRPVFRGGDRRPDGASRPGCMLVLRS